MQFDQYIKNSDFKYDEENYANDDKQIRMSRHVPQYILRFLRIVKWDTRLMRVSCHARLDNGSF